jgi:hypothetical protein
MNSQQLERIKHLPEYNSVVRLINFWQRMADALGAPGIPRSLAYASKVNYAQGHPWTPQVLSILREIQLAEMIYFGEVWLVPQEPLLLTRQELGDTPVLSEEPSTSPSPDTSSSEES